MKKLLLIITSLFIFSLPIAAQEYQTPDFLTVKTEKGLMIVNNNKPQPFAFLLEGKEFVSDLMDNGSLRILVDGRFVFVTFVNRAELFDEKDNADANKFLDAHRTREINSLTEIWEQNIKAENESFANLKTASDSLPTLFWNYTRPTEEGAEFDRDAFYSTVVKDLLLEISTPLKTTDDFAETQQFLRTTLESLSFLPGQMQTPTEKKNTETNSKVKTTKKPKAKSGKRKP